MQIFVKCLVVLVLLTCLVQQIHSELCSENSSSFCKKVNFLNTSDSNTFNSETFPSSIVYGLSVLAVQSANTNNISNCAQQFLTIIKAVKNKEIWALKSKKSHE